MKFWLIITLFDIHGDVVNRKQILYADEARCYLAMDYIKSGQDYVVQMECVPAKIS